MAKKKSAGSADAAAIEEGAYVEPVYQETFVAKANHEGNAHEVILRGEETVHTLVLRKNAGKLKDGVRYTLTLIDQDELDGQEEAARAAEEGGPDAEGSESTDQTE